MIPIQQAIPGALAAALRQAPLTAEKVAFAWRMTVGSAVDRATSIELRGDVLYVRARDAVWRREIARAAPVVRARLAALLGDQTVRALDVTIG